jgi:hypothetical protein
MAKISDVEVRRLVSYLKQNIDGERLAEIENELRDDYGEEFLREPDLLEFFPELSEQFSIAGKTWNLRIIPHAHLRMIQRSIKLSDIVSFFSTFVELYEANKQSIFVGHYMLYGRIKPRNILITIRVDIDMLTDIQGYGHVVTVHAGRGNNEGMIEVNLPV